MKYGNIQSTLRYVIGLAGTPLAAFSDKTQATAWHGTVSELPQFKGVELFDTVDNVAIIGGEGQSQSQRESELQRS